MEWFLAILRKDGDSPKFSYNLWENEDIEGNDKEKVIGEIQRRYLINFNIKGIVIVSKLGINFGCAKNVAKWKITTKKWPKVTNTLYMIVITK
jgi:hypothetical protein